jgi:hypothetical protein
VLGIFILVALRVAALATFILFQVLLPALFLSAPDRRRRMLEIGQIGQRRLRTAGEHIRYQFLGGPTPSAFVPPHQRPPRTRISIDATLDDVEDQAENLADQARDRADHLQDQAWARADHLQDQADELEAEAKDLTAETHADAPRRR